MAPVSLMMSGTSIRTQASHQRRPLNELKSANTAHRSVVSSATRKNVENGVGARLAANKRPATAQPTRSNSGRAVAPDRAFETEAKASLKPPSEQPLGTSAHHVAEQEELETNGNLEIENNAIDQRLSAELLRILEERSLVQSPPQKVSPHKEVAERASEECPRRPLDKGPKMAGKHNSGLVKSSASSRLTPCAPAEPKVSSHSRKTVKATARAGCRSRPQTAAPSMERSVTNGAGHEGGEDKRDSAAAMSKRRSAESVSVANAHRAQSAGLASRQQQQAERAGPTRERNFNRPTSSSSGRGSKEEGSNGGSVTSAEGTTSQARAAEKGKTFQKSRSTIADLIARFRNGPPQRPEDRKASTNESGPAPTVFWWQKCEEAKSGDAQQGAGGLVTSDSQSLPKDGSEESPDLQISSSHTSSACMGLGASSNTGVARGGAGRGSRSLSSLGADSDVATLRDAWCETVSQQHEAASRSSLESMASVNLSRTSLTASEVELRRSASNSGDDVSSDGGCASAKGSVESLDHRASLALRQASAIDSTFDATDSPAPSNASSRPSGLNSQLDEAEDLLEQWRAERRARQAPLGARAKQLTSATRSSREGERAKGHAHLSSRTCAGGHAGDRGGSDSENAMDSAVSRIRRRLGMQGKGDERSAESGAYPRRMREMTARHSSDSEGGVSSPHKSDVGRKARGAGGVDPLSMWRGEKECQRRKDGSIEREGESGWRDTTEGAANFSTPMAVSSLTRECADSDVLQHDVLRTSLPYADSAESSCGTPRGDEGIRTSPRSSTNSALSSATDPSPKTPPRSAVNGSVVGLASWVAPVCSPERRHASLTTLISPRSPRVGGLPAQFRQHVASAAEATVDNILFSPQGVWMIDAMFLGVDIQTRADRCADSSCPCAAAAQSVTERARVHWKQDDKDEEYAPSAEEAESRPVLCKSSQDQNEEPFHFREVGYARWDSREEESLQKLESDRLRSSARRSSSGSQSPDLSPSKFEKTHISISAGDDVATVRDSPWNRTGKSDEMPRWSHTVWSDNLSKTPGGNSSFSHTRCTHNTSITENIDASPSHTQTRRTEHNVSITEAINASLLEDPQSASIISEDGPVAQAQTPRMNPEEDRVSGHKPVHRRGRSIDDDFCILEDLDMADGETGEVFVDRGGGVRGGVSPKTCERAHGCDQDSHAEEDDLEDEDDAIVRALRQRMQQISSEIASLQD